eukprot:SAG31_NODE_528_length_14438_cov_2.252877_5_plen_280_part_00
MQAGSLTAMLGTSVLISLLGERRKLIFGGLLSVATLGNATLFCLPTAKHDVAAGSDSTGSSKTKPVSIAAVPKLLARSKGALWLVLCFLHNGFGTSFASGTFTADVAARTLGSAWVGYVMAVKQSMSTLAALNIGILSNRIGRYPCFLGSLIAEAMAVLFLCFGKIRPGGSMANKALIFVLAGLLGGGMAGVKITLNTIAGDIFPMEDTATALSCCSISSSFAAGSAFLLGPSASLTQKAAIMAGFEAVDLTGATIGLLPALAKASKKQNEEAPSTVKS